MYVQLGSDNGGIVVNLGIDGVAFQAARKLTVEKNSTLNLRLRGSGLNVDLVGELVWLGATQKEAGICFKSLSTKVQSDISNWIAREAQLFETTVLEDLPRPKPIHAMSSITAGVEKSVPHSLSAALAMSHTISVVPPPSADADANKASLPKSLDSATGIAGTMPLPEIFVPIHEGNVTSEDLEDQPESRHADSSASPEQFQVEQPWRDQLLSKLSPTPTNHPYQSLAGNFPPIVVSGEPVLPVRAELPQASAESPGKIEPNKTQEIEPIPQDQIPRPPDNLLAASVAERWIPPALLAAWRRGDRHHKLVLASIGAACLGIFALILTLAVAHIDSPVDRSARSGPVQQSTAPPAVSSVSVGPPQTGPIQSPSSPPAAVPRRSHRPQKSLLANLADNVFGRKPEVIIEIDEDQVGVQVWTSKTSGFYYCADSPFYNAVQPGTLMTQRDALQSGYQPRLGQFCN